MINLQNIFAFYRGRRVFITGHSGFKGTWLCLWLRELGAQISGLSLDSKDKAFSLTDLNNSMASFFADIRDISALQSIFTKSSPEIVFHLAAQPLVRTSYHDPLATYSTNVMGTVNLLECIRKSTVVKSFLNITTDKVYENKDSSPDYHETDRLDGYDPYANSKSCSEIISRCYKDCFFADKDIAISTARAGNVIGGGDFSCDRIIPDCFKAAITKKAVKIRNPHSVRPWQYILDVILYYLIIAAAQFEDKGYAGCYNIGPGDDNLIRTEELANLFCRLWGGGLKTEELQHKQEPHEASYLKLDSSKIKERFGIKYSTSIKETMQKTVDWYKSFRSGKNITVIMTDQINEFMDRTKL